jgi:hypothetical protein
MLTVDRQETHPQILCDFQKCPNLALEMRRFRKKRTNGVILDTGNRRSMTHAVECLEYLSVFVHDAAEPYIKPKGTRRSETAAQRRVRVYRQRLAESKMRANAGTTFQNNPIYVLGPQGVHTT